MKVDGHGKSRILTPNEQKLLFSVLKSARDRLLVGLLFYTGCRVNELVQLKIEDVTDSHITFRKGVTKGKTKTRQIPIASQLKQYLHEYFAEMTEGFRNGWLFPGKNNGAIVGGHISTRAIDYLLREASKASGLDGISSHSGRRTLLNRLYRKHYPVRDLMQISGHSSLSMLSEYLESDDVAIAEMMKDADI